MIKGCLFCQRNYLSLSAKVVHYQCIWTLMMKGWKLRHRFKRAPGFKKYLRVLQRVVLFVSWAESANLEQREIAVAVDLHSPSLKLRSLDTIMRVKVGFFLRWPNRLRQFVGICDGQVSPWSTKTTRIMKRWERWGGMFQVFCAVCDSWLHDNYNSAAQSTWKHTERVHREHWPCRTQRCCFRPKGGMCVRY